MAGACWLPPIAPWTCFKSFMGSMAVCADEAAALAAPVGTVAGAVAPRPAGGIIGRSEAAGAPPAAGTPPAAAPPAPPAPPIAPIAPNPTAFIAASPMSPPARSVPIPAPKALGAAAARRPAPTPEAPRADATPVPNVAGRRDAAMLPSRGASKGTIFYLHALKTKCSVVGFISAGRQAGVGAYTSRTLQGFLVIAGFVSCSPRRMVRQEQTKKPQGRPVKHSCRSRPSKARHTDQPQATRCMSERLENSRCWCRR